MRATRVALAGLVAALAWATGACGSVTTGGPALPVIQPTPAADPFSSAIIMTRSWASAEASIAGLTVIDGREHSINGEGYLGLDEGLGSVTWSTADGLVTELVNERAVFASTGAGWARQPGWLTDTSCLADPLRGLAEAPGTIVLDPADGLRRYRVRLPLTAESVGCSGMSVLGTAQILAWPGLAGSVDVTGWVDPNHRLVRIDRELTANAPGHSATAAITTRLENFGIMLDLESPPSASVTSLP
ncbi:MAG: hypothetical protein Q7V58_10620 [Actinomycetota bacterium]|nr:hypothetical protein [Actinomycetota bacterium]